MKPKTEAILVYNQFIKTASDISAALAEEISIVGPIAFPNRKDNGLGYFLSRAVIGQQLSTKAARSIWKRVEGAALYAEANIPDFFSDDCIETVRVCGVSRNKIKALQNIRQAEIEGRLCGSTLREMDHESRSQQLLAIWGIGRWTSDMASIFYCRCPDVWPEGDVAVQKTFDRLIGKRNRVKAAACFAPYRSYLALYMWRIVDGIPTS